MDKTKRMDWKINTYPVHYHSKVHQLFLSRDKMKIKYLLLLLILFSYNLLSQEAPASKIVIMPFQVTGVDPLYVQTVESILRMEIDKHETMEVIPSNLTTNALSGLNCIESDCAVEAGKKLGADKALSCRLAALGEKIIIQFYLADISSGKNILMDQITALSIEELETVMKRIASSVVNLKAVRQSAEVGNILEKETEKSLRRSSRNNVGLMLGYLYPQHGYDGEDKSFTANLYFDHEIEDFAVGAFVGARYGLAMNIYSVYLATKTDFCPYIGGSFGFHWVGHSIFNYPDGKKKRDDGFEIAAIAGMRLFHTYNFQIVINLEFVHTFNDYQDQAIVFTIGIL